MNEHKQKVQMFRELVNGILETYEKKNNDYNDSFSQSVSKYGYIAGIVRMSDKFNRAENLLLGDKEADVKDESAVDTLLDLASYSIMLAIEVLQRRK